MLKAAYSSTCHSSSGTRGISGTFVFLEMFPLNQPTVVRMVYHNHVEDVFRVATWRDYMLARRSNLNHPLGMTIELPRLIPSFSSKGFPFYEHQETGKEISEVSDVLANTGPTITDSILISAYDLSHEYLLNPEQYFGNKELIIIDSGGYELSEDFDSTEVKQGEFAIDVDYDIEKYTEVLSVLPNDHPIIITNFDYDYQGKSVEDQIREAQKFFNQYTSFGHDFIIKPTKRKQYLDINEIISHIDKLQRFDVIGVTEKELGGSLLERMTNIANLRIAMDRKSIDKPIHIWGGLDPVISPLYFCAGAEIFDGISWLRYGYCRDIAISRDSYTAITLGSHKKWRIAESMRQANNIGYLENMTINMRRFADSNPGNFEVFGEQSETIRKAYQALCTRVPELKGEM